MNVAEVFKEPVKREDLPKIFGCSDRAARRLIAELMEDHNIVNLQDGRGYVLADDVTAIRYAMQERKRGISALTKANKIIARCAKLDSNGIVVPVRAHIRHLNKVYIDSNQMSIEEVLGGMNNE